MAESGRPLNAVFSVMMYTTTFPFDEKFNLCKKQLAFMVFRLVLTSILVIMAIDKPALFGIADPIGDIAVRVDIIGGFTASLFSAVWILKERRKLKEVRDNIVKLRCAHLRKDSYQISAMSKIYLVTTIILTLITFGFGLYRTRNGRGVKEYAIFLSTYTSIMGLTGQFIGIIDVISNLYYRSVDSEDSSDGLLQYDIIYATIVKTRQVYEPQILVTLIWHFVMIVLAMYILLSPLCAKYNELVVVYVVWLSYLIFPIILIIGACNFSMNKAKSYNHYLYCAMMNDESRELMRNDKLSFHLTARKEIRFTACGFFSLDNSLICSMIVTTTTYLVIVLQYSGSHHKMQNERVDTDL